MNRTMNRVLMAGVVCFTMASCTSIEMQGDYKVVPLPNEINLEAEATPFKLTKKTTVAYPEGNDLLKRDAEFLSQYVQQATGYALKTQALAEGQSLKSAITLALDPSIENTEGYTLTTTADGINIAGKTAQGVFYGVQTLRKAIPAEAQGANIILPAGKITDAPRFGYRGMHLDVGRHFFSVDFVKEYIDLLALHNMNAFHWHLTEDQGWRIEIKKYPELTKVGSVRAQTLVGHLGRDSVYDGTPYGGFFTQEEAREIVAYAAERYINVIPEIDLPGHMLAALASYPELGCTGGPYKVAEEWGIFPDVLCIGNENAMVFLENVLGEICDIFPSKYIHIGGDEAPRVRWHDCPKCQAKAKELGLKADKEHSIEDRLQSYCMARMEKYLNERGRQIIGWDEILEGDVAPNATVMSWRGVKGGIKASEMGHDVIMTPNTYCYFDYYQSEDKENEPLAIGGFLPIEKTYNYNPTEGLDEKAASHILGVQANVWTEYIGTEEYLEYMTLPRMDAISEVQWMQNDKKNYECFLKRVEKMRAFYDRDGKNYAKHIFQQTEKEAEK